MNRRTAPEVPERTARWLLWGIVLLALLLRMAWPTLAEFKRDEATVVRRALAIAYEGERPAAGVDTSMGAANLPLTLYLMAIPLRLWPDPVAAVLFTGLLNGLAVWACYAFGKAYFGRTVGLMAAFLFAVSPWAIVFGRKIWVQNLPLINVGFFAALFAALVRGRPWALVGAFAGVAALIGLHMGGLAFIPILLISLCLYRREVSLRPLLVGGLVLGLAMMPYGVHDALQGWPNARDFLRYAGGEAHFSGDALRYAFTNTGSAGIHSLAGALWEVYRAGLPDLWWLNTAMMALLAVALLYAVVQAIRGPLDRRRPLTLMLIWFAVPIALQSHPTAPVYPFYFNVLYPVQFLFIAILLADLAARFPLTRLPGRGSLATLLVCGMLAVWGGWQLAVIGRLFDFMVRHPSTGGYGIPLRYVRRAAADARTLATSGGAEIVVLSRETNPAMHETPAVFEALLFGSPHRFADGSQALPVPDAREAVYLVGPLPGGDADGLLDGVQRLEGMADVRPASDVTLPDGVQYRLLRRYGADRADVLAGMERFDAFPNPNGVPFENGVTFMGYALPETVAPGETLTVWLAWWVRHPPPGDVDYHFFVHLLDAGGGLRGQHDGMGFPAASWRAGDLVVSRFAVPLPPDLPAGRYTVWAGMYTFPDVVNVSYLDVANNPAGQRVLLGEVAVEDY